MLILIHFPIWNYQTSYEINRWDLSDLQILNLHHSKLALWRCKSQGCFDSVVCYSTGHRKNLNWSNLIVWNNHPWKQNEWRQFLLEYYWLFNIDWNGIIYHFYLEHFPIWMTEMLDPPRGPNSFIFMQFSAKNLQINRLAHPLWQLAPSSWKSWIRRCILVWQNLRIFQESKPYSRLAYCGGTGISLRSLPSTGFTMNSFTRVFVPLDKSPA